MISTFKLEDPETAKMTLATTMSLYNWKKLKDQLSETSSGRRAHMQYPASYMFDAIKKLIDHAEKHFELGGED